MGYLILNLTLTLSMIIIYNIITKYKIHWMLDTVCHYIATTITNIIIMHLKYLLSFSHSAQRIIYNKKNLMLLYTFLITICIHFTLHNYLISRSCCSFREMNILWQVSYFHITFFYIIFISRRLLHEDPFCVV